LSPEAKRKVAAKARPVRMMTPADLINNLRIDPVEQEDR
jgi:hypothetical protein